MSIVVVCTARASWSKLQPVVRGLVALDGPSPILYLCASAVLERFGSITRAVKAEFPTLLIRTIYSEVDGYNPTTAAKGTANLLSSLADAFHYDQPDLVVVNHDRHEVLAAAQAASYANIKLAHIGCGEKTGSIDDKCRDAISQLSDVFFPATKIAGLRTYNLTGSQSIFVHGCPSMDNAPLAVAAEPVRKAELSGSGADIDPLDPFILVVQHSDTDVFDAGFDQMMATLRATQKSGLPVLVQYSNADAGTERLQKAVRVFKGQGHRMRTIPNLPPQRFLRLLSQASVFVGNSSAGIRESSFLGVPTVNVGDRQRGRERGPNVVDVGYYQGQIEQAISEQLTHGPYKSSKLYGYGRAGERIAKTLVEISSAI